MAELSTRREFLGASATGALGLTMTATAIAAENCGASRLQSLGRAWQLNLEQQRIAGIECDRATTERAARDANDRFEQLVDVCCELEDAIENERARTKEELAIKARVVLREIDTFGCATGIAVSLAQDLIRLASEEA